MKLPVISIGMLTYNHGKYVADTLESLLLQEYEQLELIILDDASVDETPAVIEKYLKRLKDRFMRVEYFRNENNCGNISRNCNRLIKEAEGEFYFEVSGDDILLPQGIRLLYEALSEHPECIMVHANLIAVPETYRIGDEVNPDDLLWKNRSSGVESDNLFQRLMYQNCIVAPTAMLRMEVFGKYGYHDENIGWEDYEYWLRISRKEKVYFLNKPVILYKRTDASESNINERTDCRKIQNAMEMLFLTKEKYIGELSEQEQKRCWQAYYISHLLTCKKYQYQGGIQWLEDRRKAAGIELEDGQTDYVRQFERCCKEADILATWVKIKKSAGILGDYLRSKGIYSTAIYGYSRLGGVLHSELINDGIKVEYLIDRKGKMLECTVPVYTIEETLPPVDAIIVAPPELYRMIKPSLEQKTEAEILDLGQIIEKLAV